MQHAVRWMQEIGPEDSGVVGEEVRLLCTLSQDDFSVPPGFVLLPSAYESFVLDSGLLRKARADLGAHPEALPDEALAGRLEGIRAGFLHAEIGADIVADLRTALERAESAWPGASAGRWTLTVRPFLVPEVPGLPLGSLSGEAMYGVGDAPELLMAVRLGWMWPWRPEPFTFCAASGVDPLSLRVVLLLQRSLRARVGGVFYPRRGPDSARGERVIDACWGMGEAVLVDGFAVDRFVVRDAPLVLLAQNVASKERKLVPEPGGLPRLVEAVVPEDLAEMPCLGWEQIQEVAGTARAVGRLGGRPREVHWAYENGDLYILRVPPLAAAGGEGQRTGASGGPEEGAGRRAGDADPEEAGAVTSPAPRAGTANSGVEIPTDSQRGRGLGAEGEGGVSGPARCEIPAGRHAWPEPGGSERSGPAPVRRESPAVASSEHADQGGPPRGFPDEPYPGWRLSLGERARARVLSSLFRSVRKRKGQGGPVRERDEFSHRHTDSRYWNESYYFNFTDPGSRIGGFSRIGMVPNQDMAVGILYLFPPEGGILVLTQSEPCRASRDSVSAGLLRYERVDPLWVWRIRFEGSMLHLADPARLPLLFQPVPGGMAEGELEFRQVQVDLRFEGWSPCHDFKGADPAFVAERFVAAGSRFRDLQAVSKVASEHYEQVGGWQGEIVVDGRRTEVRGSGHRDHSWGDRDWKAPAMWTWLTAQFGRAFGFNLSRVVIRSLDLFNGYVCRSGRNVPLRRAWLETEFEQDGLTQKRIRVRLQDTDGWEAEVEGRPKVVVPLILRDGDHRTLVNEAFTGYTWDGRTGYGISEYLHQLGARPFPAAGRPVA